MTLTNAQRQKKHRLKKKKWEEELLSYFDPENVKFWNNNNQETMTDWLLKKFLERKKNNGT